MQNRTILALCSVGLATALASIAACTSDNSPTSSTDGGPDGSGSSSGSSGADSSSSGDVTDAGVFDRRAEAAGLGLLVDNMIATTGTQVQLTVPAGQTPGSYYAYSDYPVSNTLAMTSSVAGTKQLADMPVSPAITNADGSQIVGELCFGGTVVGYAGLGMSLAYGNPPDATPDAGSSPVPFDASHYGGVSFYIFGNAADASISTIHFGVPDTQTADPTAWPTSDCAVLDGGKCDDDFGADVPYMPGQWTKVAFKWDELFQQGFGIPGPATANPISSIKTTQLIGMKWQANGAGVDAAVESFNFCISNIYFTP